MSGDGGVAGDTSGLVKFKGVFDDGDGIVDDIEPCRPEKTPKILEKPRFVRPELVLVLSMIRLRPLSMRGVKRCST